MDTRSHYDVLGVSRGASDDDIKKAYRKLARQYHPDKNPGDQRAEETFKRVGRAFEILSDPAKRKLYDEMGDDAEKIGWDPEKAAAYRRYAQHARRGGQPGRGPHVGGKGGGVDWESLFGTGGPGFGPGFGQAGRGPQAGVDISTKMQIGFVDSIKGGTRELRITKPSTCDSCHGTGEQVRRSAGPCSTCGGTGQIQMGHDNLKFSIPCQSCGGSGRASVDRCAACGGTGIKTKASRLQVKIPPGMKDGQKIRLGGQGAPGRHGGPAGDLYIEVSVASHPYLRREDNDLYMDLPVTVPEALLGAEVEVPTLDGRVKLKIPPGSQNGAKLRLRNKGVPGHQRREAGHFYAVLKVVLPETKEPADALKKAAEAVEALYHGHDVRKHLG